MRLITCNTLPPTPSYTYTLRLMYTLFFLKNCVLTDEGRERPHKPQKYRSPGEHPGDQHIRKSIHGFLQGMQLMWVTFFIVQV